MTNERTRSRASRRLFSVVSAVFILACQQEEHSGSKPTNVLGVPARARDISRRLAAQESHVVAAALQDALSLAMRVRGGSGAWGDRKDRWSRDLGDAEDLTAYAPDLLLLVPPLCRVAMFGSSAAVRKNSVAVLGEIAHAGSGVLAAIPHLLQDEAIDVRRNALALIEALGSDAHALRKPLWALWEDTGVEGRIWVVLAVEAMTPSVDVVRLKVSKERLMEAYGKDRLELLAQLGSVGYGILRESWPEAAELVPH